MDLWTTALHKYQCVAGSTLPVHGATSPTTRRRAVTAAELIIIIIIIIVIMLHDCFVVEVAGH